MDKQLELPEMPSPAAKEDDSAFERVMDVEWSDQDAAEGPEVVVAEAIAQERAAVAGEVLPAIPAETQPEAADTQEKALAEVLQLADLAAASGCFPGQSRFQLAQKAMVGRAIGISPALAFQHVIAIRNQLSLSAELQRALLQNAGYRYRVLQSTREICEIELLDDGEVVGSCSFTIQEAQQAGLMRSDAWKNYPADMLFARCSTRLVSRFAPHLLFWAPNGMV